MKIGEITQPEITTAYHITTVPDAEYILEVGLTPTNGKIFLIPYTGNKKQFKDDVATVAKWMYAKTEDTEEPLTILKVDVTGIQLATYNGWPVSAEPIAPERIQDLGERTLGQYY
jgi:hypothetical protein